MDEKADFDQFEKGRSLTPKDHVLHHDDMAKHGDRALSVIGDERVTLTEEEVRRLTFNDLNAELRN